MSKWFWRYSWAIVCGSPVLSWSEITWMETAFIPVTARKVFDDRLSAVVVGGSKDKLPFQLFLVLHCGLREKDLWMSLRNG